MTVGLTHYIFNDILPGVSLP